MLTVTIQDVGAHWRDYFERVRHGETITVTEQGRVIAEVRPATESLATPRPYGLCAGQFATPDDFDAPLPKAVLRDFDL